MSKTLVRCCVFGAILLYPFTAWSATVLDDPALLEEQRRLQKDRQESLEQLGKPPRPVITPKLEIAPITLLADDACQTIKNVWLYGADHLPTASRQEIVRPYIEQCVDNAGITRLYEALQNWYLNNGYITSRVILKKPQTSLKFGNLEIWVVEGRIGRFILGDNSGFDNRRIATAFPVSQGDVLNIRDIDQGMDNLNSLFSQQFRMKIQPSDKAGYSDILLIESANTRLSFYGPEPNRHLGRQRIRYDYSNGGVDATGNYINSASLSRENLFGLNERFEFSWLRSTPNTSGRKENKSFSGLFDMPFGYWRFTLRHNNSHSAREIETDFLTFVSSSEIETNSLGVSYLFSRTQRSKLTGTMMLRYDDRKNYINNTLVEVSSRRASATDLSLNYTRFLSSGTLILSPMIKNGVDWFGGKGDPDDIQEDEAHAEYHTANLFALYHHYFLSDTQWPFSLQTAFTGQYSDVALYGENQIVVGGEYSVRGFKENILSGDSGWTWRNDLYLPLGAWSYEVHGQQWLKPLKFKLFLDYGKAISNSDRTQHELSGSGIGLEYQYRWLEMHYTYAKPRKSTYPFIHPEDRVKYYGLSLNVVF